jgi:hypothetical protein
MGLQIPNLPHMREVQAGIFGANSRGTGWLLLTFIRPSTVAYTAGSDSADLEGLRRHLDVGKNQCALVRLAVPGQTGSGSKRDVFVQYIGLGVDPFRSKKERSHVADVKELMQPFDAHVNVTDGDALDTET